MNAETNAFANPKWASRRLQYPDLDSSTHFGYPDRKSIADAASHAASAIVEQDKRLLAPLGKVSIAPLGTPLAGRDTAEKEYNIRLEGEPDMRGITTLFVTCVDKRLSGAPAAIAEAFGINEDEILTVSLAGGVVQPGEEELKAAHLDTSFIDKSKEEDLETIISNLILLHQEQNEDTPLRIILAGHAQTCAYVKTLYGEAINKAEVPEETTMTELIQSHALNYRTLELDNKISIHPVLLTIDEEQDEPIDRYKIHVTRLSMPHSEQEVRRMSEVVLFESH